MDRFKLFRKQEVKIPVVGNYEDIVVTEEKKPPDKPATPEPQLPSDQEILDTIENCYYSNSEEFDATRYELEKIEAYEDKDNLEAALHKFRQQHNVVSTQVLQMILEKQSASQNEFQRVCELEKIVEQTREIVHNARSSLADASSKISLKGLAVIRDSRRRRIIQQLLGYLKTLIFLRDMELNGEAKLDCGDLTGAIRLFVECLKEANMHRQFVCVNGLTNKLQGTLVMAEEHLDRTISNLCYSFDGDVFGSVEAAYRVLGKGDDVPDQLLKHFSAAVQSSAVSTVAGFLLESQASQAKHDFSSLCEMVNEENFINCLTALCKNLWAIFLSFHQLVNWYIAKSRDSSGLKDEFREKLEGGQVRLWNDIQNKVSSLVSRTSVANYKFDDLLHFLAILHRVAQIGEEVCGEEADNPLANSIKTQSLDYFSKYHRSRMDDLADILDNEPWTPCPIRHHFNLLHLQEWRGLRLAIEKCSNVMLSPPSDCGASLETSSICSTKSWFSQYPDATIATPFDETSFSSVQSERILREDSDLGRDYSSDDSDDENGHIKGGNKLVTNTTLTILRWCGKYLQMAKYLDSITEDVVSAVCQLFEYYLHSIYKIFTEDPNMGVVWWSIGPSIKLQAVLKRIRESLFEGQGENSIQLREPITSIVHLSSEMCGLEARIVGVESLVFLSEQYLLLRPYLEGLLNNCNSSLHKIAQFYSQCASICCEVRGPAYWPVALAAIKVQDTLNAMQKVKWELKDVSSQHNFYVDAIFSEVELFSLGIESMRIGGMFPVPKVVVHSLWDSLAYLLAHLFVEGFASSHKCSHSGRCQMQLDWGQLESKVSKICPHRPVPYIQLVRNYILGYYHTEPDLQTWLKQHYKDYTEKQLMALINSTCLNDKKARQRLAGVLEELVANTEGNMQPPPHR